MRRDGGTHSFGRFDGRSLWLVLCLVLLATLVPATAAAAQTGDRSREYIVTLKVADSTRVIKPSNRTAKQRIARRDERSDRATRRLAKANGFAPGYSYGHAFTGFAARMTPAQAASVARDEKVLNVRPARRFKLAAQVVPAGVRRVKSDAGSGPGPDVDADVAVIDTGIGPGTATGDPLPIGPAGSPELNIAGGVNCYDAPWTPVNEAITYPGRWADTHWHGTHVAGTIGARDNGVGVVGVAPGVRLWAVRVFQAEEGSEAAILCGLDWAVATYANELPDIDVINMSIQGPRLDTREDCGQILADPFADPIQQGVCRATAIGISVVAAAGNQGFDANNSSPGGYDQVISVGAMTDFDGEGWGAAPPNRCDPAERDDTYATYSNYGREIDILAPGTCVESLWPTQSGEETVVSTGTSMAAPHVTGAVARYLAGRPGTPPDVMRRIVRAAGRMDWNAKSDPLWSGVNDPDEPNRVLDVRALTGGALLRTWIQHDQFTLGREDTTPITRVDVQRGGGYDGGADLSLTGLPAEIGSASFDAPYLAGIDGLGTRLRLALAARAEGAFDLGVQVTAAGIEPFSRPLRLTVDRSGPRVTGLSARPRAQRSGFTPRGNAQTIIRWDATDGLSGIKSITLQRRVGTKAWRDVASAGASSARVTLKPGTRTRFRVKTTDNAGNRSTSRVMATRLMVRDSTSSQLLLPASGGWAAKPAAKAYKGSVLLAKRATDSISTRFKGKAVALVAQVGRDRGTVRIRIDDGGWQTVKLTARKAAHRKVVWSRRVPYGSHVLEVQAQSGKPALDAVLFIR